MNRYLLHTLALLLLSSCSSSSDNSSQPTQADEKSPSSLTPTDTDKTDSPTQEEPSLDTTEADETNPDSSAKPTYPIVDTMQAQCFNATTPIDCPTSGSPFYGQDGQQQGNQASYLLHEEGTVSDQITGLMWMQSPDLTNDQSITAKDKLSYSAAIDYCESLSLAGYNDWRLPDIKTLYSLIDFRGLDPSSYTGSETSGLTPFIDTRYFGFGYGDTSANERLIDAQFVSATRYVSTTMNGDETVFGVNFADGRIKGYPTTMQGSDKTFYTLCVRDNPTYGSNRFVSNGDGTITDEATQLMWQASDSGVGLNWEEALKLAEQRNSENHLGYRDWRLPTIKELQSLLDYSLSPDTHANRAAIDSLFGVSAITNEAGQTDAPYYWSSTTHATLGEISGGYGAYIAFGRAIGSMDGGKSWLDVHGAGAQRSDPKSGNAADYPQSHGPQGDALRVFNYVRLVRSVQ
ncbi:DUF1566 domain-containing protein [Ectothiorhodospiraceae bacterium BW-2]|nr:DUF1566 domain-containing protein [Ectothiorhodospiraceae bacterium BW-2]